MSVDIDGRYLTADTIDDALGSGIRLYTDRDELYEAWDVAGNLVRIHGGDEGWYAQVHVPASTDPVEGYDTFDAVTKRLDTVYDTALATPATPFLDRLDGADTFQASDGDILVQYLQEDAATLEPGDGYDPDGTTHAWKMVGVDAGAGAATGAALGAGSPESALFGFVAGGAVGALAGLVDGILYDDCGLRFTVAGGTEKGVDWSKRKKKEVKAWYANRKNPLEDADVFDRFNEKQRLEAIADETHDAEEAQRYREIRDSGIEEHVEDMLERQFDRFDEQQGVAAQYTADSYREAARFVTTALDAGPETLERPSLFQNPGAFRTIFEAADEGRQEELVGTVLDDETDAGVVDWLEETYPEQVEDIGRERALWSDRQG